MVLKPHPNLPTSDDPPPTEHTLINITNTTTPDPFIVYHASIYHLTFTANTHIPLWSHPSLLSFSSTLFPPDKTPLWTPPPHHNFQRLWAPELHSLRGKWYVYFAAADGRVGNKSHRMYVLSGPEADKNPRDGGWEFEGVIVGMDRGQWAIDGTVFEVGGRLFLVYSGWPWRGGGWEGEDERWQELWIYELESPTRVVRGPVRICWPDREWEFLGDVGINEGPQWLVRPGGGWKGLVYSAGPSWTKEYKMATLELVGDDPMDVRSWRKGKRPLLQNRTDGKGPFAPGHGSFLQVGGSTFSLFHAVDVETDNTNRSCRMQRVYWTANGPDMGGYVGEEEDVQLKPYETSAK